MTFPSPEYFSPITLWRRGQRIYLLHAEQEAEVLTQKLLAAIEEDKPDEVERLCCETNVDVSRSPESHQTSPLLYALALQHIECARRLLKYKANIYQKNEFGHSTLSAAVNASSSEMVTALLQADQTQHNSLLSFQCNGTGRSVWHLAANSCDVGVLLALKQFDPQPNITITDRQGRTPLHLAVMSNMYRKSPIRAIKTIEILKECGWTTEAVDHKGKRPLDYYKVDETLLVAKPNPTRMGTM